MPGRPRSPARLHEAMRKLAEGYADAEQGIACAGTAVESRTYKVNGRAFLFLRPQDARLKLAASLGEAADLAASAPEVCSAGAGGWVHVKFGAGAALPSVATITRWIAESYELMGGGRGGPTKARAAKPGATGAKKPVLIRRPKRRSGPSKGD